MAGMGQVSVIYNPGAGSAASISADDIESCLSDQGLDVEMHVTEAETDLDELLPALEGIVVACGGDGTLSAILHRVAGRPDLTVACLPMGTANNLAHTLGLPVKSLDAIADLASRAKRKLDIGHIQQGHRSARFLEGFGCGLYAELLRAYGSEGDKSPLRAIKALIDVLPKFEPVRVQARVDGKDLTGEYLLFAVLNTKRIGPQIELAPNADPSDGRFEVVAIEPDQRNALVSYVQARIAGGIDRVTTVETFSGRDIEITPNGLTYHHDIATFDTKETGDDAIRVRVESDLVSVLVPPQDGHRRNSR